jgi:hypothetical protein
MTMPRVFISASSADRAFVKRLRADLNHAGIDARTVEDSIKPGDSIGEKIAEEIESADVFVVTISKKAERSLWVGTEIALAVAQQERNRQLRVIPILAEPGAPAPFFLRDHLYVDMSSDSAYRAALSRLVDAIRVPPTESDTAENMRRRQLEALEAERKALDAAVLAHRQSIFSRTMLLASALTSLTVVVAALAVWTAVRGKGLDELISYVKVAEVGLALGVSVVTSILTNFVYKNRHNQP